jgi:hypothetical protein
MKQYGIIIVTFIGLFAASIVFSGTSVRCGKWIVESGVGLSNYAVLKKCGEPTFRDGNRWIYNESSRKFTKILVFHEGKLEFIREESRN